MTSDQHIEIRLALVEQNYQNLTMRIGKVEEKLDDLHKDIKDSNVALIKAIVGGAATVTAGMLSIVVVLLIK